MTFHYDADQDQLAVQFSDRTGVEASEIAPGFVVDFDEAGHVVGFEIEHASEHVDLERLDLGALPVAQLNWRSASTLAA